jgi:fructose-bisphosphate aldolase/2-amino-3,7-dideoxy-D-threo-hept-6-ulosonate synthase
LTSLGKELRLKRIFDQKTATTMIVPMDHPVEGYFKELEDPRSIISSLANAGVNGFLLRRGLATFARNEYAGKASLILRMTCCSGLHYPSTDLTFVSNVQEAIRMGADAVVATIFVGSKREIEDLAAFGALSDACDEWGIPLLGEMMPIGGEKSTPYDGPYTVEEVKVATRVGCEEGADFIKTYYTGDSTGFREVVKYSTVPVIVAGGPKANTVEEVLTMVKGAMDAGAKGIAMGRKMWGSQDPVGLAKALSKIIREGADVNQALALLKH